MPGAPTPATVTTEPLARRRSGGLLLFASGSHEPLARRPTDIALAILTAFVIVLVGVLHSVASDVGAAATALAASLPDFFDPLWSALVWTALGWALAMVMAPGGNEGGPSRPMNRHAEPQEPPVMSTCRPSAASPPRAIPAAIEASSTMR